MSSRKRGFVILLGLSSVIMSVPQLLVCFGWIVQMCMNPSLPRIPIPGIGPTVNYGTFMNDSPFWHDRFLVMCPAMFPGKDHKWIATAYDPETGQKSDLGWPLYDPRNVTPFVFGERLWLLGSYKSWEVQDGILGTSNFASPPVRFHDDKQFLLNNQPAILHQTPKGIVVSSLQSGRWGANELILPGPERLWSFGAAELRFGIPEKMVCFSHGDRIHLFVQTGGRLLYREGLELGAVTTMGQFFPPVAPALTVSDDPASALKPSNTDAEIAGWSLVRAQASNNKHFCAFLIDGQPAAMIVDEVEDGNLVAVNGSQDEMKKGYPIGTIYQFDGTKWSQFANIEFPLATYSYRALQRRDGQGSYISSTTRMGYDHTYRIDSSGVRLTKLNVGQEMFSLGRKVIALAPLVIYVQGMVLGAGIWFLMRLYTKPNYAFGLQSPKLASLGRRGMARLLDLTLIACSLVAILAVATRGLDWETMWEALNLKIDHPTLLVAEQAAKILAIWLAVVCSAFVFVQGRWGITPGKWFCGLRTVRTTLRPCGLKESFARELVFLADTCCFFCWTPGLLSIALSDHRQRLGDFVADTIVIESSSMDCDNR